MTSEPHGVGTDDNHTRTKLRLEPGYTHRLHSHCVLYRERLSSEVWTTLRVNGSQSDHNQKNKNGISKGICHVLKLVTLEFTALLTCSQMFGIITDVHVSV